MKEFDKLKEIIDKLRSKDGCPWDRKQTNESLLPFLYEEANEVVDTILNNDYSHLKEELGDLLLQIMLHSKITEEKNQFSIKDVLNELCDKLQRRHPHVFDNVKAENSDEVKILWEEIKKHEKKNKKIDSILDTVPGNFMPLLKSYKLQKEAAKVGFDWDNYKDIFKKIAEEIDELEEAININHGIEHEIGDLFFTIINLSRKLKIDPQVAISKANKRFIDRFKIVEDKVKKSNKSFKEFNIEELEEFWQEAKKILNMGK
jgi:tetrapyrrole methylase family protein/MazG family protein